MREKTRELFSVMFEPGEEIVATPDKYAANSMPQDQVDDERSQFLVINPVSGWRLDANVTAFRNFLVELDDMPLKKQDEYVARMGMPYSACVFSGNKSLHYLIALDKPLPSLQVYNYVATWVLNIMSEADQSTKNPTRGLRFPGFIRDTGREQKLIKIGGRVPRDTLNIWLHSHPDKKPVAEPPRKRAGKPNPKNIRGWVKKALKEGVDESKGRNNRWYAMAYEFYVAGYEIDQAKELLGAYFDPEPDFSRHEWESTIKHAYKDAARKVI